MFAWAATALTSDIIRDRTVVEVGAYDVNGSVRGGLEAHQPSSYLGVDLMPGPGVDLVADVADLPAMFPDGFEVVVSTEMLEHVMSWKTAISALITILKPGGTLAVSTRSPGFPLHEYPRDTFRYTPERMHHILTSAGLTVVSCVPDPEQPGVFAVATKPTDWAAPDLADRWAGVTLPIWDGSIPEAQ